MTPPKGYKYTELGVLPEDWEVVRLGDIGKIVGGGTPSTKKVEFWSGTIPWISSSDIDENSVFDISQTRYITQEAISKSSTKPIEPNSILIVSRVGLGKVAVNQNILCTSQDIQALTQHKQNAFFLVYAIKNLVSLACRINQGTSIKGFTKEVLSNLCIPLPPLAEQEKIAGILSAWDTQIQNFETLITEKQALKKGLCQTLLTAKTRLKGFSEDWEVVSVGEIFRVTRGNILATDRLSDLSSGKNCYPVFSSKTKDGGLLGYYSEYLFEDCITWTTDGANAGDVNFRKGKFYCTNVCGVLISDSGYCNQCVAEILNLRTRQYVSYVGNPKLMNNTMKEIEIEIPSNIAEQEKIAEILSEVDNEITLLEQKLESLKSQKKGLMQKLLGGKIRINFKG